MQNFELGDWVYYVFKGNRKLMQIVGFPVQLQTKNTIPKYICEWEFNGKKVRATYSAKNLIEANLNQ